MYDLVPTKELAVESISSPLTPKSQSLISPSEFTKIFDGFTSNKIHMHVITPQCDDVLCLTTSMDNAVMLS